MDIQRHFCAINTNCYTKNLKGVTFWLSHIYILFLFTIRGYKTAIYSDNLVDMDHATPWIRTIIVKDFDVMIFCDRTQDLRL